MTSYENDLISALPRVERLRLLDLCEPVKLELAQVLAEAGQATRYAYFPPRASSR